MFFFYDIGSNSKVDEKHQLIDRFNLFVFSLICFTLCLNTDYVPNQELKYNFGFLFLALVFLLSSVNLILTSYEFFKPIIRTLRYYCIYKEALE